MPPWDGLDGGARPRPRFSDTLSEGGRCAVRAPWIFAGNISSGDGRTEIQLLFHPLSHVGWGAHEGLPPATDPQTVSETVSTALRRTHRLKRRGGAMVISRVLAAKRAFIAVLKALAAKYRVPLGHMTKGATDDAVRKAYKRVVLRAHPVMRGAPMVERFPGPGGAS